MGKVNLEKIETLSYYSKESYKALRTNISFCGSDVKTILFTSCTQNEGKSTVAFNVAASLASTGKKVILIDADLRKSVMVGRYKIDQPTEGLSHYLSGQSTLDEVIDETNIPSLDMILCGKYPPNPTELVGHENFEIMLHLLRKVYDYVIIDSPPLGMVIDSAIMAKHCDGTVIVTEACKTNYKYVLDVKNQIERSGCKVLGVILNKVVMERKGGYGKYGKYGGKYGRYYGQYYGQYYGHDENVSKK